MSVSENISRAFNNAEELLFDDSTKIVLMSDVHRGDGSGADNFYRNRNIYQAALSYYYDENYIYIELGDGDDLWETNNFHDIAAVHADTFTLLGKFCKESRLHMIFGNHDMVKSEKNWSYNMSALNGLKIHEGLILKHRYTGNKFFLVHGHQADFLNYNMWKAARFLVRYLWRPLELIGIKNPTRPAISGKKKRAVERCLSDWALKENHALIAGHTHRHVFPKPGEPPYFNDGCCVNPGYITAIEIESGKIFPVKWLIRTKKDGTLFVGREILL